MAWALQCGGHAHEQLALLGLQGVRSENHGLLRLQALCDRRLQKLLGARLDLLGGDPSGELGAEGFQTALRLGGGTASEVKRILFRPAPRDD